MNLSDIIKFYKVKYEKKVFFTKLSYKNAYIMYIYNTFEEYENFSKTFLYYLPFYTRNNDFFENVEGELSDWLLKRSRNIRVDKTTIPDRNIENNGIYGELFLDFYLRIVKKRELVITYMSKRSFNSNYESRGLDSLAYYFDNNGNICLNICEAKFVCDQNSAKKDLLDDINGTDKKIGHLTEEFFNQYYHFVVCEGSKMHEKEKIKFKQLIDELNKECDNGNKFLDVFIRHNVFFKVTFFAIFSCKLKEPEKLKEIYEKIYDEGKKKIEEMKIVNYEIKIVFIPTDHSSMEIKRKIEEEYENK